MSVYHEPDMDAELQRLRRAVRSERAAPPENLRPWRCAAPGCGLTWDVPADAVATVCSCGLRTTF